VCLKDQDCAVDFNDNDEVTTTSTSHKSSSHLAPSQVHLPSPVSLKLQSKSSDDSLSLISQAPIIRTHSPERALLDANYDNVCLKDQDRAVDCNDNNECIFCSNWPTRLQVEDVLIYKSPDVTL
jgi:hypothetical protein